MSVRGYNDITPRFGVAYDLFGNGKTALKFNGGKYLEAATGDAIYSSNNPAARIITRIGSGPAGARTWTDGNRNFVVDCNLQSFALQDNLATGGDLCGAIGGAGLNFGSTNPNSTTINPEILGGWGVRPNDWQIGESVQHELLPREQPATMRTPKRRRLTAQRVCARRNPTHPRHHTRQRTSDTFLATRPFVTAAPFRPAARRLQAACSGPRITDRSLSSWPTCQLEPGTIGRPHRQQHASPPATNAAKRRRTIRYSRDAY